MSEPTTKITWRNSPWTAVIGFPLLLLLIFSVGLVLTLPRAVHYRPDAAVRCRNNLGQLELMKKLWAEDEHKQTNDVPTNADLFGTNEHLRGILVCPAGGTYTLGTVAEKPRCSIPGHTI